MAYRQAHMGPIKTLYTPYHRNEMSAGPPPPAGPRFRIVAGRGLGEGRNQPLPQREQAAASPQPPLQPQQPELRVKYEHDSNVSSPSPIPHPQIGQIQYMNQMGPGSPLEPVAGPQPSGDAVVDKCTRFFKTLVNLAKSPEHQGIQHADGRTTSEKVHELVVSVILGHIHPEQFTQILQDTLRSQAQPHLMPFLRKTLPALRAALRARTVQVEGVDIPVEQLDQIQEDKYSPPPNQPPSVGMIPVSMGVPQAATSIPAPLQQNIANPTAADVEMEESKPEDEAIHVRALQENVLKSAFIRPEDIMKKITERMKEACYVEEDVLTLLSDAVEYRLREILAELTVLAEHRMENLRASAVYAPIDDVKGQIRFLENMDRQQFEQSENREKEALIKLSKGKGMAKETIEKAKEMQRQDAEAKRNRDANAAAIAALSSKSVKPRWDSAAGSTGPAAGHGLRPKTIRINIRDFQAMANNDPLCSRTNIVHKLALGGGIQGETI